jgi:hypothetical protein
MPFHEKPLRNNNTLHAIIVHAHKTDAGRRAGQWIQNLPALRRMDSPKILAEEID